MRAKTSPQGTSYDEVPYDSHAFAQTHPRHLATLAHLFGLEPPPLARCRVLELGCAGGGNLVPMALAMPEAQFVGVDLSQVQIEAARALATDLSLTNAQFLAEDLACVGPDLGTFDYIVAHGVFSWISRPLQEQLLALCAERLSERGIAYISYNTLPGWHMHGMIRDLMRYHALRFDEPAQRITQARAILDFLAKSVPAGQNAYGLHLRSEVAYMRRQRGDYLLHEYLEETNDPLYFHEFAERVSQHGLEYLGEAEFATMLASNFSREVQEMLARISRDVIEQEQYMDFLRNRSFRQTLLVHKGEQIERNLVPERVRQLYVSSALRAVGKQARSAGQSMEFRAPGGGVLTTSEPITQAAMSILGERWPRALSFNELLRKALSRLGWRTAINEAEKSEPARVLASDVLQSYAAGLSELQITVPQFAHRVGSRVLASPLARLQADKGLKYATTLRHQTVGLDDDMARLLPLLDGTRSRQQLYRQIRDQISQNPALTLQNRESAADTARQLVDHTLDNLVRSALIMA